MKKIQADFFIIALLVLAAPIGVTAKTIYNKYIKEKTASYSIQISPDYYISDLEKFNYDKHYNLLKEQINNKQEEAYFAACSVFNRYKQDLLTLNKSMMIDDKKILDSKQKTELLNWCLDSKILHTEVSDIALADYYYALGLSQLYGINSEVNINSALSNFKIAETKNKKFYIHETINIIYKYQRLYPNMKDEFLIIYIDNELSKINVKK